MFVIIQCERIVWKVEKSYIENLEITYIWILKNIQSIQALKILFNSKIIWLQLYYYVLLR